LLAHGAEAAVVGEFASAEDADGYVGVACVEGEEHIT
jgi:hypothetical protein